MGAQKMPDHRAGCTGKKAFPLFDLAAKAARRRNKHDVAHLEAYHCRHCRSFHVGERRDYGVKDARRIEHDHGS